MIYRLSLRKQSFVKDFFRTIGGNPIQGNKKLLKGSPREICVHTMSNIRWNVRYHKSTISTNEHYPNQNNNFENSQCQSSYQYQSSYLPPPTLLQVKLFPPFNSISEVISQTSYLSFFLHRDFLHTNLEQKRHKFR